MENNFKEVGAWWNDGNIDLVEIDGYLEDQADTLDDAIQDAFVLWGDRSWNMSDIDENNCFTIDIE